MKRIDQIQTRREKKFYERRMATAKKMEKQEKLKELAEGLDLIKAPVSAENALIREKLANKQKAMETE